jgi:hypothetical protein
MAWKVDFYRDDDGFAAVEDFIAGLSREHKAKALAIIRLLEEEGPSLPYPYSSQVQGKIRELRTQLGKDKIRILYFGDARRYFILLHGLVKRSDRLSEEDIQVAEMRMHHHIQRVKGS